MNTAKHWGRFSACALAVFLMGIASSPLVAESTSPAPYQGGPGMMGGYGMGPGMMGGYGMGPGMMGGYGMGPGMMGGYGMGPGMMGGYWGSALDLTDEQQAKINKIQDETRKSHWALMSEMMDQQARLRDLYLAPKRDDAAVDTAYKNIGKLQQRMYETSVETRKRIEAVLTKEQQDKLREHWRKGGAQ